MQVFAKTTGPFTLKLNSKDFIDSEVREVSMNSVLEAEIANGRAVLVEKTEGVEEPEDDTLDGESSDGDSEAEVGEAVGEGEETPDEKLENSTTVEEETTSEEAPQRAARRPRRS